MTLIQRLSATIIALAENIDCNAFFNLFPLRSRMIQKIWLVGTNIVKKLLIIQTWKQKKGKKKGWYFSKFHILRQRTVYEVINVPIMPLKSTYLLINLHWFYINISSKKA